MTRTVSSQSSSLNVTCVTAESWQPSAADDGYKQRMRQLWLQSWSRVASSEYFAGGDGPPVAATLDPSQYTLVPPEQGNSTGPTNNSTGLGLPLSRALAKAGGGWLGLADSVELGRTIMALPPLQPGGARRPSIGLSGSAALPDIKRQASTGQLHTLGIQRQVSTGQPGHRGVNVGQIEPTFPKQLSRASSTSSVGSSGSGDSAVIKGDSKPGGVFARLRSVNRRTNTAPTLRATNMTW